MSTKKNSAKAQKPVKVSPHAQKIVDEYGIDLQNVVGTGKNGTITKSDIQHLVPASKDNRIPIFVRTRLGR